jgi:phage terminase large subunit-like protein
VYCGGRAGGKTRGAAEYVTDQVEKRKVTLIALIGESVKDVRTVMIEGPSGLASPSVARPWMIVDYEPSKAQVRWYDRESGQELAVATIYSAENPEQLRGPQYHLVWMDELAKYRHRQQETWDQVQFGLRLKTDPQPRAVITTTPQPTPTFKAILRDPRTVVTTGTTFDNWAQLDEAYLETMRDRYEGTRLGRQELYAHILDDAQGALWGAANIRYQPVILEGAA